MFIILKGKNLKANCYHVMLLEDPERKNLILKGIYHNYDTVLTAAVPLVPSK